MRNHNQTRRAEPVSAKRKHGLDGGDDGFVRMEQHLAILVAPDKADRQAAPELAAFCLIANAAVETRAQHVKLGFAHSAFETEQQAIVEERGMIDAVGR